jgi:XTP/dITP diphosphohydrolase
MKIVLASDNKGKIKEIKELYKNFEVISLKEMEEILGKKLVVSEEQNTFEKNALEKCSCLYELVKDYDENVICIADDSGISIDGLNGFPGVHTARWMNADDHTKNLELLIKMEGNHNRGCHYTTSIALISKDIKEVCSYTLDGTMTTKCIGDNGFGFDEIFMLPNNLTLAQISTEEKYKISPRTKALDMIKEIINNI